MSVSRLHNSARLEAISLYFYFTVAINQLSDIFNQGGLWNVCIYKYLFKYLWGICTQLALNEDKQRYIACTYTLIQL